MPSLDLTVNVDPKFSGPTHGSVNFETGLTRTQAADPTLYAYEHHGDEFSIVDPGALTSFYEDLLLGRPMPLRFLTRTIRMDTVFAIALFLHRDLVPLPVVPSVVASVDLVHRRGIVGMAHVDESLAVFLYHLGILFPPGANKKTEAENLKTTLGMVAEYLSTGQLPYQKPFPEFFVKDLGTNGFVYAEVPRGSLTLAWAKAYRAGHLRGFLMSPKNTQNRRQVVAARKSLFVSFNLPKAASMLNEIETGLGQPGGWIADELWLHAPPDGTSLHEDALKEVFLRV